MSGFGHSSSDMTEGDTNVQFSPKPFLLDFVSRTFTSADLMWQPYTFFKGVF